jgi:2-dehydro-3-deoxy-D-arabinonate dehydratase
MQLAKYRSGDDARVGRLEAGTLIPLDLSSSDCSSLSDILESSDPAAVVQATEQRDQAVAIDQVELLAPIDQQEVWAAGVTYKRSQAARMEESEASASCYDLVYRSDRPELFLKATPHRVSGPGAPLRIRWDASWNVPEPELTLVITPDKRLVGFTIGNDMSSRDIEGENPLYLPQAKVYDQSAGLGPCITLCEAMPSREQTGIRLKIERNGETVFEGNTSVDQMARSFEDLIDYLGREQTFPDGVFLMTGTGVVPENDFTLEDGDIVHISIDGIGTLTNPIVRGTR